jgi:hypothetical protein
VIKLYKHAQFVSEAVCAIFGCTIGLPKRKYYRGFKHNKPTNPHSGATFKDIERLLLSIDVDSLPVVKSNRKKATPKPITVIVRKR